MALPNNFYTPNYFDSDYWNQEARMGARWHMEDHGYCSCNGSGYILTNIDTWIRCGCPLPEKPWVTSTIEDYRFDQATLPQQQVFSAYAESGWAFAEVRFCRDAKFRTLTSRQEFDEVTGEQEASEVTVFTDRNDAVYHATKFLQESV